MEDGFGRKIEYLRISLTDKCNLRCLYCMPKEGIRLFPRDEILTFEEIERLARIFAALGIKKVRLTGGEPLVRKNMPHLVEKIASIPGIAKICMTTNGLLFNDNAQELKKSGLSSVNFSLDTLREDTFFKMSGGHGIKTVLEAIENALALGFQVKINCVPCKGINDGELPEIALLSKNRLVDVRFIELMPLGMGKHRRGVSSDQLLTLFEKEFGGAEKSRAEKSSPASYFHFPGFAGKIGFISPLSHAFCKNCNRIRLTADGMLRLCLCQTDEINVKKMLRKGLTDDTIKEAIKAAVQKKPASHSFLENDFLQNRIMTQIGG